MGNILFLSENKIMLNSNMINVNMKFNWKELYLKGKYNILKYSLSFQNFLNFNYLKSIIKNSWFQLNTGFIGILFLNGLGFKSTRKLLNLNKKYWRFNVGHSHVFQYFSPKNIIMKIKNRFIYIFGFNKTQVFDIIRKIKSFHMPDIYKGVGIKYPDEIILLKKGKTRQ